MYKSHIMPQAMPFDPAAIAGAARRSARAAQPMPRPEVVATENDSENNKLAVRRKGIRLRLYVSIVHLRNAHSQSGLESAQLPVAQVISPIYASPAR